MWYVNECIKLNKAELYNHEKSYSWTAPLFWNAKLNVCMSYKMLFEQFGVLCYDNFGTVIHNMTCTDAQKVEISGK